MQIIDRIRTQLQRKPVRIAILVVLAVLTVTYFTSGLKTPENETSFQKPIVQTTSPSEYLGGQTLSLIGNVRAFTEAEITSEQAGRVTSVNVTLGQQVSAGTVLATLENASEYASLLQAEGAYEAALAGAAQSDIGVNEANNLLISAQNNTISTLRSAMNTTNGVVVSNIDQFFSNPNSPLPGLRVGGQGYTSTLNKERVAFQDLLPEWQQRVNSLNTQSDLISEIDYAKANVLRTIEMINMFLFIFDERGDDTYNSSEIEFTNLRTSLNAVVSSLDATRSQLLNAEDTVERAKLSASGGTSSLADAQVKQALGVLRSAQANLAKTILRTPISGTVNSISLRTGDYVNSFSKVAVVANNNAFEIVTYISDSELKLINEGDKVLIEGEVEGVVTKIAPAVDSATRKTEVRIASEGANLTNGDTVRITKETSQEAISGDIIQVPLTAVKFEQENGSVFLVEDGKLVARPVVLGTVLGGSVEIIEGISTTDEFVIDARGLVAGTEVEIQN